MHLVSKLSTFSGLLVALALCFLISMEVDGQRKEVGGRQRPSPKTTPRPKFGDVISDIAEKNSPEVVPFLKRFPPPPRVSDRFHFPMSTQKYWSAHKRPFVPDVEPDFDFFDDI